MREVFFDEDTIYAPVTPNVHSAVSIIRVSGDRAIEVVDKIFRGKRSIRESKTHTLLYGNIVGKDGEKIDDVLVAVMRKPNSYTGEDVVEINCHGNPIIVSRILELLKWHGLRMALPGEFTKRAVINGKIDLIQAEAINSLIMSRNAVNVRISRNILDGSLSRIIGEVKEKLLDLLAYLEVLVDHPEEDLAHRDWEFIEDSIRYSISVLKKILDKSKNSKFFTDGIKICIVGKTNSGKSSLMNALLGEDRSIVSNIPGTTRDVVKEITSIEGVPVSILDTAGIRESKNTIEMEGIKRTIKSIESSDVILAIFDFSSEISEKDITVVETIKKYASDKNVFVVFNKIDKLVSGLSKEEEFIEEIKNNKKLLSRENKIVKLLQENGITPVEYFFTSAKMGVGIKKLAKTIVTRVVGDVEAEVNNILINNERHREMVEKTIDSLGEALESAIQKMSEEFIAIGVRDALAYIGEMIGEITTEDLMDRIFKNFCIGK
ncbi:MAG: tRNA uridine-5-carboxymethylaminomethyl(34) synthesis GTPase MnmE [Brevinematia bacterium]